MTWTPRPLERLLLAVAVLLVLVGGPLARVSGSPGSPSAGFASPVGTARTTLGAIAGDAASRPVEGGLPDIGPSGQESPEAKHGVEAVASSEVISAPRALSPADAADLVRGANPVGAALKSDPFHRAGSFVVDDIASNGSVFRIVGGDGAQRTLVQMPGEVNGIAGRFEWIVDDVGNLTHQLFVKGGSINGVPVRP